MQFQQIYFRFVWKVTNCWQNCFKYTYLWPWQTFLCIMYAKYILSLYQNIFVKIACHCLYIIDTDLDPDLDTAHGSRSSPIPKIVRRSTPLPNSNMLDASTYRSPHWFHPPHQGSPSPHHTPTTAGCMCAPCHTQTGPPHRHEKHLKQSLLLRHCLIHKSFFRRNQHK